MTDLLPERLTGALKNAAEAFFRSDLSDVRLHWGDWAGRYGSSAFAYGSDVYLPNCGSVTRRATLELLGHELAHCVQQREGRVQPTCTIGALQANDDPALESEASTAGWNFARGLVFGREPSPAVARVDPVMQCSISVGGRALRSEADLVVTRSILDLIDGGPSWLAWAINSASVRYSYSSERDFLLGMQSGLHGTELMLLRSLGLQLHPFKLLELHSQEIRTLVAAAGETPPKSGADYQAKKILAKYDLLSLSELTIGTDFLEQVEISAEPVFQGMTLGDRIALFELVDGATSEVSLNPMIQAEAAQFAVQHAQNPSEFVDYYQFYISLVDDGSLSAKGAPARGRKAHAFMEAIEPLLYGRVFCPAVQGVPSRDQLCSILQNWVADGNGLGFDRLSLALSQVSRFAELNGATGEAASRLIGEYVSDAEEFVTRELPDQVTLRQDGQDHFYRYSNRAATALVRLAPDGSITLIAYEPKRQRQGREA